MMHALGDLGIARERMAKVERELDATHAVGLDYARERDRARAEAAAFRAEMERLRGDLDASAIVIREQGLDLKDKDVELGAVLAEVERLRIVETASIGAHALLEDAEDQVALLRDILSDVLDPRRRQEQELIVRGIRQDGDILHGTSAEWADWTSRERRRLYRDWTEADARSAAHAPVAHCPASIGRG